MAANALVSFFDKADGESIQKGKEKWIEIQGWGWGVDAETSGTEDGKVAQKVEMVFETVKVEYKPQNKKDGTLGAVKAFTWDIPAGTASPSA